ncbi:hypothetical protein CUR178_03443 [Leishmania enriettii]|uniref:Uncharacterized protein n=1 Tax=Leishmania enriettii TaxID=5663 RepID=A0A836HMT7_LEIEN|nr:hypothetical protein CUR178_03443 [Leishmania enriettii]
MAFRPIPPQNRVGAPQPSHEQTQNTPCLRYVPAAAPGNPKTPGLAPPCRTDSAGDPPKPPTPAGAQPPLAMAGAGVHTVVGPGWGVAAGAGGGVLGDVAWGKRQSDPDAPHAYNRAQPKPNQPPAATGPTKGDFHTAPSTTKCKRGTPHPD